MKIPLADDDMHTSRAKPPNQHPGRLRQVFRRNAGHGLEQKVNTTSPVPPTTHLQVTIPILMPSGGSNVEDGEALQYAIGVTKVIWNENREEDEG
jgi:hypothetical protein